MSPMYQEGSYELPPDFVPKGEPKNLNASGTGKPSDEAEADAALAELGAKITKSTKLSSLTVEDQKITIPSEGEKSFGNQDSPAGGTKD